MMSYLPYLQIIYSSEKSVKFSLYLTWGLLLTNMPHNEFYPKHFSEPSPALPNLIETRRVQCLRLQKTSSPLGILLMHLKRTDSLEFWKIPWSVDRPKQILFPILSLAAFYVLLFILILLLYVLISFILVTFAPYSPLPPRSPF
jgi:hypothetical protein